MHEAVRSIFDEIITKMLISKKSLPPPVFQVIVNIGQNDQNGREKISCVKGGDDKKEEEG